jgi:hypothetical protein
MDWNAIILLAIALLNAYTAWAASNTRRNMALLEKNTNSIKDALVLATGRAEHGRGVEQGRAEGRASEIERTTKP